MLTDPGGTPYDGTTADKEGLAVLPNGDFLVSSEVEPSIRIFGRDGVRFLVYDRGADGGYALTRQVGYRVDVGMRIAEMTAYGPVLPG